MCCWWQLNFHHHSILQPKQFHCAHALSLGDLLQFQAPNIWWKFTRVTNDSLSVRINLSVLSCGISRYTLGWRGGAWYARRAFRREQQKMMMGHMKSHNRWHWRPFNRLRNRLRNSRLASKNKSADAHPSVGQSSEAPSTSSIGASANVSGASQPAAGSAWTIYAYYMD